MDRIHIEELTVFANHGVLPEETRLGQKFLISLDLFLDTSVAAKTGELSESIDYAKVCEQVTAWMRESSYPLIETAAEQLAKKLLLAWPPLHKVQVTVKKPWAPIHLPLENVSVTINRGWHKVYLGVGSNLGDKERNLKEAIRMLREDAFCRVERVSPFIVTEPVGGVVQDDFLNGAVELKTLYAPQELLEKIGSIEKALKRERVIHWGPRTIDLDILLYDQEVIRTPDLFIPHIEMENREFVLEPLCEIAPEAYHPLLQKTVYQMYADIKKRS